MEFSRWKNCFVVMIAAAVLTTGVSFALPGNQNIQAVKMAATAEILNSKPAIPIPQPPQKLSNPPEIIKAVYVTGYSAGTRAYLKYLTSLFNDTQINAVVVDIKASDGWVSYASGAEEVKEHNFNNDVIGDVDSLVRFFHDKNIYVIGRIAVFEDPVYAKAHPELAIYNSEKTSDAERVLWRDNNGLAWLDPASKEVWDYQVALAKDAFYHGFDEVNFDYVRFPTDGKMSAMGFPVYDRKAAKAEIIKSFFVHLRNQLPGEKISADLFGLTTVNTDDMGIGQIIENALENFDYVSPMVYPSHYGRGFIGFENPAEHPYEVVKYSMDNAVAKKETWESSAEIFTSQAKFRPWIQDFNMGADYNTEMVKKEIKAIEDALAGEYCGFMLWNPSNIYTKSAILK